MLCSKVKVGGHKKQPEYRKAGTAGFMSRCSLTPEVI
jgi:hypothetical protein